jgi:transcriptional regulator with XRE-family HTH domain
VTETGPTVRQRELGKRLRELRGQRGLTIEDVANRLLCSPTKISRLETGARRPSLRDVRDMCALYSLDAQTSAELMDLTRGARDQVWWTQYEDHNLDPYLGLEQVAVAITSYTTYYVPALLQTIEYTRAVIKAIAPKMDPAIFEQRVEIRMRRQEVLEYDHRPHYQVFLDEAVLHRRAGGSALMAAQLERILKAGRSGMATIQIIPFRAGVPAAQDSNFVLLEFDKTSKITPIIFVEGLTGNQYIEHHAKVARYREAIKYLSDSGLSPQDSAALIGSVRNSYLSE